MKVDALTQDAAEIREPALQPLGLESARKRFVANALSNAVFIAIQALANLWLTPFLIGYLGMATFGMIPLANSIASYMSILTNALNNALSRFLVIDLGRGDAQAANKTFNTALFSLAGFILALSPVAVILTIAFPILFDVPAGWEADTRWLFALVALTSFVTVIASNFGVSAFIHSKFLLTNTINFIGLAARIGFIVILFALFPPRLWVAGGGALVAAVISLLGFTVLWRKLTPQLHVRLTAFDRSQLQALMGMGGWVIVNTLGGMLLARVDLLVVNAFFGAALTGGYGSVAQFALLVEYLADAATTVTRPIILIKYAHHDFAGLRRLASQSVKLLGLALALPVGLLCGFSRPLLSVWLGPEYQYLSILLIIITAHQSVNLSVRPLLYVQTAYNRIRWPGIATLLSGVGSLGLGVLLAMWGRWGAAGVALAVAIAWTAKNALYIPIYTAHIMKLRWWSFLPSLIPGAAGTLIVGIVSYGLTMVQMPHHWFTLGVSAAVVSLLYVVGVWLLGLNPDERQMSGDLLGMQTVTRWSGRLREDSGGTPMPRQSSLRKKIKRSHLLQPCIRALQMLHREAQFIAHCVRSGLLITYQKERAVSRQLGGQKILTCSLDLPPLMDFRELIAWLKVNSIQYHEGNFCIYIPPQAGATELFEAALAMYPANSGLKILKDLRPPDKAIYCSSAVNPSSPRMSDWISYRPPAYLRVANYLYSEGLGPRVYDLIEIRTPHNNFSAYVIEHVDGTTPSREECAAFLERLSQLHQGQLKPLEPAWETQPDFHCPDCRGNLIRDEAAGKLLYIDFQAFLIRDAKQYVLQRAAEMCAVLGCRKPCQLSGGRLSDGLFSVLPADRHGPHIRWNVLREVLQHYGVSVEKSTVFDIGCNTGALLYSTLVEGAAWAVGWDRPEVATAARRLLLSLGVTRFDILGEEISPDTDFVSTLPSHIKPMGDPVLFFLSMRKHIGFPQGIKNLPFKYVIYESDPGEHMGDAENHLNEMTHRWGLRIMHTSLAADNTGSERVISILCRA